MALLSRPPLVARCRHLYTCSDLHVEHSANRAWIDALDPEVYGRDVLLVAGDVADRLATFKDAMRRMVEAFQLVFYVPGNHELWLLRDGSEGSSSLEKLERLEQVCRSLGVITSPQRVQLEAGAVHVCPLVSFHHTSFDSEPDISTLRLPSVQRAMADWRACRFPPSLECGSEQLAEHIDRLNALMLRASARQAEAHPALLPWRRYPGKERARDEPLVTFSHFLPRIELCPEKRYLRYPDLMKAVGSVSLGRRVQALRPDVHVFGHTHFGWDAILADDGIRYVQAALATPDERRYRMGSLAIGEIDRGPLQLFDGEAHAFCAARRAAWSSHYERNPRTPQDTRPAPWVLDYYLRKAPSRVILPEASSVSGSVPRDEGGELAPRPDIKP